MGGGGSLLVFERNLSLQCDMLADVWWAEDRNPTVKSPYRVRDTSFDQLMVRPVLRQSTFSVPLCSGGSGWDVRSCPKGKGFGEQNNVICGVRCALASFVCDAMRLQKSQIIVANWPVTGLHCHNAMVFFGGP